MPDEENKCGGGCCGGCGDKGDGGNDFFKDVLEDKEGNTIMVTVKDGDVKVEPEKEPTLYQQAGVDIEAADEFVENIGYMVNPNHKNLNSFCGMMPMPVGYKNPYLAFSTDGVGTKGRLCIMTSNFKTIGIDLVNVVVNDLLCSGAKPLAFLDYMATGKLNPKAAHMVVQGIQVGCDYCDMTLVGGETAELPGQYKEDWHHDFAGSGTGVVDREDLIDGSMVKEGDVLIGLRSNGIHANGFALIQKLIEEKKLPWFPEKEQMEEWDAELKGMKAIVEEVTAKAGDKADEETAKEEKEAFNARLKEIQGHMAEIQAFATELLRPVKSYYKAVMAVTRAVKVTGIAHISGGGIPGNVPRMLSNNPEKDNLSFDINVSKWEPQELFHDIKSAGEISDEEMWQVFNCGIGMVLCVDEDDQDAVFEALEDAYEDGAVRIGTVITREEAEGKEIIIE